MAPPAPLPSPSSSPTSAFLQNPPLSRVADGLYLGDSAASRRRDLLEAHGITAVVSLSDARWTAWRQPWFRTLVQPDHHLFVPCRDSTTEDLLPRMAALCDFIERHQGVRFTDDEDASSLRSTVENVLVHCEWGVSRSPTVVLAYLMRAHRWTFDDALVFVARRRRIQPNYNFREQLQVWAAVGYEIWADAAQTVPKPEYAAFLSRRRQRLKRLGLTGGEPVEVVELGEN